MRGMPQAFTPWEMEREARERAFEAAEAAKAAAEAEAQAAAPSDSKPQASGNGNGQGNGNGNPPKKKPVRMKMEEHSFVGPSRPRAIYTRPSRELPSLKVRVVSACTDSRTRYHYVRNGDGITDGRSAARCAWRRSLGVVHPLRYKQWFAHVWSELT